MSFKTGIRNQMSCTGGLFGPRRRRWQKRVCSWIDWS